MYPSRIRIRNPATAPDDFVVEVTGAAAAWSSVIPWTSPIGPGAEAIVSVAFRPPASSGMAAGTMPFGVNVTPTRAPGGAVSAEGTLEVRLAEVAPVLQASLDPVNSEGRTHVEHVLSVWNPTQNAVQAELSATDEAGFLAFDFEPSTLLVSAGGGASAQLRVRPRKRIVFRRKKVRPFRALVTADGSQLRLEGSMLQRRYIPLWAMPIFGASLLVLIAAALVVILAIVVIVSLALD